MCLKVHDLYVNVTACLVVMVTLVALLQGFQHTCAAEGSQMEGSASRQHGECARPLHRGNSGHIVWAAA